MSDYAPRPEHKFTLGLWRWARSAVTNADDGEMVQFTGIYDSEKAAALRAYTFDRPAPGVR